MMASHWRMRYGPTSRKLQHVMAYGPMLTANRKEPEMRTAVAFAGDAPCAAIHRLDGRHFLLESHLDTAAGSIRRFLQRTVP